MIAQRFLHAAQLTYKACVLKCYRGIIRRHGKQLLINLVGKIGPITRRSNETALAVDTDRNHYTAEGFVGTANLVHYFIARNLARNGEPLLQPFRKCIPSVAADSLDSMAPCGIAQTHKGEIKLQRFDQQIGQLSSEG